MRKLALCASTALLLSAGCALAQGSNSSAIDTGSQGDVAKGATSPSQSTVGRGAADPTAAPKTTKKSAKKKMEQDKN